MSEQDPLKKNRLGLRGMLLVSGGVLVGSSIFLIPTVGLFPFAALSPDLPSPAASAESKERSSETKIKSQGTAAGPAGEAPPLLPVYWVGDVDGNVDGGVDGRDGLFREFVPAPQGSSADPIADAVRQMTSGEPLDPDYTSRWQPASAVSSSISTRNVITLDISSDAFSEGLPEDEALLALQQLVYTATASAANAGLIAGGESSSVVVLVDGMAGYRAFDSVDLKGEWTRDTSTLAPVWIIDPQEGVEASSAGVTVNGVGPAAERTLAWRIDRAEDPTGADKTLFQDGSVEMSPEDGAPGAYSFTVSLPPGRYEITVSASVSDVEAEDSKTIVVR